MTIYRNNGSFRLEKINNNRLEKIMGRKAPKSAFKKGESGNLRGRPKMANSLTNLMRRYLGEKNKIHKKKTNKQVFVEKCYKRAIEGDPAANNKIWTYIEGLPQQRVDLTTKNKEVMSMEVALRIFEATKK